MITFALIAEGITDVAVIQRLIEGAIGYDAAVNPLLPIRDATDQSRVDLNSFSNWELVLEYISTDEPRKALETNDFLIIQIDTDQAEHQNFNLPVHENGKLKSISEIVTQCREHLRNRLKSDFPDEWKSRIIFAIPVLSTECWLIPLFDKIIKHSSKSANNCEQRLMRVNRRAIPKDHNSYYQISKPFSKIKVLQDVSKRAPCLEMFLEAISQTKQNALGADNAQA